MTTHPNRNGASAGRNPKPGDIVAARTAAQLTQTEAAELLHTTCRVWQQWEAGDRRMHPAFFDLFNRRVKERKTKERK